MNRNLVWGWTSFAAAVVAISCGGAVPTEYFQPGSDDAGAGTGGTEGTSSGSSSGSGATSGAVTSSGSSSSSGATTGSSSSSSGTGMTSSSSSGGTPGGAVSCPQQNGQNAVTCQQNDFCCVQTGSNNQQTGACFGIGSTCSGASVECAKTADCEGARLCCATQMGGNVVVDCRANCPTKVVFCDPSGSGDECTAVAAHLTCQPFQQLQGFFACQ